MWKWIVIILAVAGATFGIIQANKSVAPEPIPKLLKEPARNPFEEAIAGAGLVEPASENIAIGVTEPGMVMKVYVRPNETVKAGAKLFEIDARSMEAQLQSAKATVLSAQAELSRVAAFRRKEDEVGLRAKVSQAEGLVLEAQNAIAEAEAAVSQQKVLIEDMADQVDRLSKTEKAAATPEEQTVRAKFKLETEKSKLITAKAAIPTAQARVKSAEAARDAAKADLATYLAGAWQPDIDKAKAAVAEAQANVARMELEVDRHCVRAPKDVTVLRVNLREGEYAMAMNVSSDTAPIVLGVIDPLHIRAAIDEYDAQSFRTDMTAKAFPKGSRESYELQFVRVDPFVIPKRALTNSQHEMVDTRVLEIIYKVVDKNSHLFVGQQVDVFIDKRSSKMK